MKNNLSTDFIDNYYFGRDINGETDYDRARNKAFSIILPVIIETELTERQAVCLKYKYIMQKSQLEIAELMHLSQPTVSRHISVAKDIVNNKLRYCYAAVTAALMEYDRVN